MPTLHKYLGPLDLKSMLISYLQLTFNRNTVCQIYTKNSKRYKQPMNVGTFVCAIYLLIYFVFINISLRLVNHLHMNVFITTLIQKKRLINGMIV